MQNNTIQDAEHGADCSCNECQFEGREVESTDELIAKGWLKPEDVERTKPPVVLHRLPDWLSEYDLPDAWQLPRMLPAGAVSLFSADPKCGKTQLMLSLLNSANIGRDVLGERVPMGISVAWLTEEKRPSIRRALRRVGMDFDNLPQDWWIGSLYDREARPDWPNLAQHLYTRWHAQGGSPDVLVVDTIGRWAACEDWNSYSRVVEATAPLHEISNAFPRMAVMAIHHNKKGGGDIISAASGSNALTGAVDHIISMTKPTSEEGDDNTRKLRFLSRFDTEDDALMVRWDPATGDYAIVAAGAGVKDLIREILADAGQPITAAAIHEQLPVQADGTLFDISNVRSRLSEGAKIGLWSQPGKEGKANLYASLLLTTPR